MRSPSTSCTAATWSAASSWDLLGDHNRANALAAIAAARHAGVAPAAATAALGRLRERQAPHGSARRGARGDRVRRLRASPDRHRDHRRRAAQQGRRRAHPGGARAALQHHEARRDEGRAAGQPRRRGPGLLLRRRARLGCARGPRAARRPRARRGRPRSPRRGHRRGSARRRSCARDVERRLRRASTTSCSTASPRRSDDGHRLPARLQQRAAVAQGAGDEAAHGGAGSRRSLRLPGTAPGAAGGDRDGRGGTRTASRRDASSAVRSAGSTPRISPKSTTCAPCWSIRR